MPSHIHSTSKIHSIACIPGDGIGVDITEAAVQVLNTLSTTLGGFEFDFTTYDWSSKAYLERGWYTPYSPSQSQPQFLPLDLINHLHLHPLQVHASRWLGAA